MYTLRDREETTEANEINTGTFASNNSAREELREDRKRTPGTRISRLPNSLKFRFHTLENTIEILNLMKNLHNILLATAFLYCSFDVTSVFGGRFLDFRFLIL